jgi:hypothetical protein
VHAPGVVTLRSSTQAAETTQIAPTILRLLGVNPGELQAVVKKGTKILPGT